VCAHSGAETHSKTAEARTTDTSGQGRKVGAEITRIFGGFFHLVLIGQPMRVLFAVWSGNRMIIIARNRIRMWTRETLPVTSEMMKLEPPLTREKAELKPFNPVEEEISIKQLKLTSPHDE